jgi:hypothetical protein
MDGQDKTMSPQETGEFLSPRPYSSSPVTVTGRNKKLAHLPVPGNPPLPYDTPFLM